MRFDDPNNPYVSPPSAPAAPSRSAGRPPAVGWFLVYAGILLVLYLMVAALSIVFFSIDSAELDKELELPRGGGRMMGVVFLVMGLGLAGVCAVPFLVEPRGWVWTYDLVVICLGLTSACFWPICIPLLIYWLNPETKAYFGKS